MSEIQEKNSIHIKNKLDQGLSFKISRFKEQIKRTRPHKHDEYYELIFLSEGEGFHTIESEKYLVSAPEIYFLKPGQLHYWQFTSIPKGFVIIFRDEEFNELTDAQIIRTYKQLLGFHRLKLRETAFFQSIHELILAETQSTNPFSKATIHGLVWAMLSKILELSESESDKKPPTSQLFEKFKNLLVTEITHLHKVNQYASLLYTTPQNLNALCKKNGAVSASQHINKHVLIEAKRYILHTDHSIQEIADILSFSDVSNFIKFFKKNEGTTPMQFREKYFK